MGDNLTTQLSVVEAIIQQYGLMSLEPTLRACQALAGGGPIDLAVIGQFKSGKSSLLNAVLGEGLLPVGALPATAVVTRVSAGTERLVRITHEDGSHEDVSPARIAEFVTEAGNPGNHRHVGVVDVFTPALRDWPGVRLVDTPGLGSIFTHNTEVTCTWMPNVAVALVAVSVERPLSDQDRQLVAEARQTAPRVIVVLTKMDLLTEAEQTEVTEFVQRRLSEHFGSDIPVLPFSTRTAPERSVSQLRETVLQPVAENVAIQRRETLTLKLKHLVKASKSYLSISLDSARRAEQDREQLRAAVFTEAVDAAVIHDEIQLAKERICGGTREAFRRFFLSQHGDLERHVGEALSSALPTWCGNLDMQARQYEVWMAERLATDLTPLSHAAALLAADLLRQADNRFGRIVEAFRDRLNRNIKEAMGVDVSPISWEAVQPTLAVIPVSLSQTFMTHWDLLWWMLPMSLIGGLFRRHVLGRVPREVEKNLIRLTNDWTTLVVAAIDDLRRQAAGWVDAELATMRQLLERPVDETTNTQEALKRLGAVEVR